MQRRFIRAHALAAIESLTAALEVALATDDTDLGEEMRRGAGIRIRPATRGTASPRPACRP